jgi:L-iditol 2-dehydrogenase
LRCGECRFCRAGADNQCRQRQILGFSRDGGLAEYVPVPLQGPLKGGVTLLPDHLSFTRAIWVEPLACCLHAQNRIQVKAEDVVLIIGAGPVGLLHLLLAVHKGVAEVLMAEVSPYRRSLAKIMGASQVLDSTRSDFLDRIMALTDGRGVDVLILACSGMGFDKKLAGLMAPTGRISFFSGLPEVFCSLNVNANQIHYHEWILAGAFGCTLKDIHEAIALLADYSFPVGGIITQKVSLEQVASVFTHNRSDKELKTIVEVNDDGADY